MKNQTKQKACNDENEFDRSALTKQNKLINHDGEDSNTAKSKLGKTEKEILFDLVGELSIPINSFNTIPSVFKRN